MPAAAPPCPPLHTLPTMPRDEDRSGETRDERRETRKKNILISADYACLSLPFHCVFHRRSLALHCLSTPQVLGSFAMMGDDAAAMSPRPLQACDPFDGWALPEVD